MGELVNRTGEAASGWQRDVVWIRMNVAYIQAELPRLVDSGEEDDDVADIRPLVETFGVTFTRFCESELGVFTLARLAEAGAASRAQLIAGLHRLRESFRPWLQEYHAVVEKRTGGHNLSLSLLMSCGAELHRSHAAFLDTVDAYVYELQHGE